MMQASIESSRCYEQSGTAVKAQFPKSVSLGLSVFGGFEQWESRAVRPPKSVSRSDGFPLGFAASKNGVVNEEAILVVS